MDSTQSLSSYQLHFHRTRTKKYQICIKTKSILKSQCSLEKGKWSQRNQVPQLQRVRVSHSVMSDFVVPHGLQPTRLLCPWNSPGRILEQIAIPFSRRTFFPGIEFRSPALQVCYLLFKPSGKPPTSEYTTKLCIKTLWY